MEAQSSKPPRVIPGQFFSHFLLSANRSQQMRLYMHTQVTALPVLPNKVSNTSGEFQACLPTISRLNQYSYLSFLSHFCIKASILLTTHVFSMPCIIDIVNSQTSCLFSPPLLSFCQVNITCAVRFTGRRCESVAVRQLCRRFPAD